jgi:lysophospholipase L1-like esterase
MYRLSTLTSHLAGGSSTTLSPQPCSGAALGVQTILWQGDSITDAGRSRENTDPNLNLGTGYAQMASAILLSERPAEDLKIFNKGVGGDRIVNLYARMAADGYVLKPELMSVLVGVNDTCLNGTRPNGVPLPKYERVYRDFLSEMVATGHADWRAEIDARRLIVRKLCVRKLHPTTHHLLSPAS